MLTKTPGQEPVLDTYDTGSAKMVYALDIRKLLAAGTRTRCSIDTVDEVYDVGMGQAPAATLYLPWTQTSNTGVPISLVIRTGMDPPSLVPAVREAVRGIDPALPLRKIQPLGTFLEESLAEVSGRLVFGPTKTSIAPASTKRSTRSWLSRRSICAATLGGRSLRSRRG